MADIVEKERSLTCTSAQATSADLEEKLHRCGSELGHTEFAATPTLVDMSQIELKPTHMYDDEMIDLETIVIEDVFRLLKCDDKGLSSEEAKHRLEVFRPNKLEKEEQNGIFQFLSFMWNPLFWVMEVAALVTIASLNGATGWPDFVGVILLLFIHAAIGFYQERSSANALKRAVKSLAPKAKVRRDGYWSEIESSDIVPGDVVTFKIGDVVPADCYLTDADHFSVNQALITGESLPVNKTKGEVCFSGSTCQQGTAEGLITSIGTNTFLGCTAALLGHEEGDTDHLQQTISQIASFCLAIVGGFVLLELCVLYGRFHYHWRHGLSSILALVIGGIPIAMPTVLSVALAVGAQQLAKHKVIVTHLTAVEKLAGVTVLCAEKTGTITIDKLIIDRRNVKTYGSFSVDDVILLSAYACRTEYQDPVDSGVVGSLSDPSQARAGITLLDFVPFSPVDARTEITYREESTGRLKRVTKGMVGHIIQICSRNKTEKQEDALEVDVEELASRGLRSLAVAYEELDGDDPKAEGNGFELIGLLALVDPPRANSKQAIEDARALGVEVMMVSGDQLAIVKEAGRRTGLGDDMYAANLFRTGTPPVNSKFRNMDEMMLGADGFAGVRAEQKYEICKRLQALGHSCAITGGGSNDALTLSHANVGIAVEGATDTARGAADIVLAEPGLSTIVHAIRGSRIIIQRLRSYSIYESAVAIQFVVCFATLAFTYKFDFPPFMVLVIALLNVGLVLTLPFDSALPSNMPDSWNLAEVATYVIVYGLYLTISTVALLVVILETSFFEDTFGARFQGVDPWTRPQPNHHEIHTIIYLQVAIISQALIFVTRSHGFFFMERPSFALMLAFIVAQVISTIIAAYANWNFAEVRTISSTWICIVWVWNMVWFIPLDLIKFAVRVTVISYLRERRKRDAARVAKTDEELGPHHVRSHKSSIYESLYLRRVGFILRAGPRVIFNGTHIKTSETELQRFSSIQVHTAARTLARSTNRTAKV